MPDPQSKPTFHAHPNNMHDRVYGVQLVAGDVLDAATDVYNASSGYWEPCTCPGLTLGEGTATVWIRRMPEPPGTVVVLSQRPPLPPV